MEAKNFYILSFVYVKICFIVLRSFVDTFRVSKTTCNIMKIETENYVEKEKKELNNHKTNTYLFHRRSNINKYTMKAP